MSRFSRDEQLGRLRSEELDILVIGGGIIGAGVARDAAMRGLRVGLAEAGDFCSGTSSRSSKMLHGGIRYLEQLEFSLVFEASRERRLHSEFLSPHLSHSAPFLIPVFPWSPHGLPAIAAGVFLYDALALFRNHGTRVLSRSKAMAEEDRLQSEGLKGAAVYHDVVMDDARLGFEVLRSAAHHGAAVANYLELLTFEKRPDGRICGAVLRDRRAAGATEFPVRAACVINASGPWCDRIRALADPGAAPQLRPTKGTHLVLPDACLGHRHAFVLTAKSDNRVFFSIPWFGRTLVGTTDTDYDPGHDGPLDGLRATRNDVDYLMESVKRTFPGARVTPEEMLSSFAGLRPLVSEGQGADPSAVSRGHRIWQEPSGLISIAGGKYTTYRPMAAEAVDLAARQLSAFGLRRELKACATAEEAIVLPPSVDAGRALLSEYESVLGPAASRHLQSRYGARWQLVADLALQKPELRSPLCPGEPDLLAEALYCREQEMALTLEDFLRRRTRLALQAKLSEANPALQQAAVLFGEKLDASRLREWQGLLLS